MQDIAGVSVVMVSYNTADLTRSALKALLAGSAVPRQVIVVDNASTDGSVAMVKQEFPNVQLIENKNNLGFAKANNIAIKLMASEDLVWLLNSDTEVGVNSLADCLKYLDQHSEVAGVVPQLVYPDGSLQSMGGFFPNWLNVLYYLLPVGYFLPVALKRKFKALALYPQQMPVAGVELDYITGAAAIFRREILDKVGLLGEEYFMYFEETDLCWRIRQNNFVLMGIATDPVMHVYGGSFKKKNDSKRLEIFLESLALFVKKNYTGWQKNLIILEIKLFGRLSVFLKGLKK